MVLIFNSQTIGSNGIKHKRGTTWVVNKIFVSLGNFTWLLGSIMISDWLKFQISKTTYRYLMILLHYMNVPYITMYKVCVLFVNWKSKTATSGQNLTKNPLGTWVIFFIRSFTESKLHMNNPWLVGKVFICLWSEIYGQV